MMARSRVGAGERERVGGDDGGGLGRGRVEGAADEDLAAFLSLVAVVEAVGVGGWVVGEDDHPDRVRRGVAGFEVCAEEVVKAGEIGFAGLGDVGGALAGAGVGFAGDEEVFGMALGGDFVSCKVVGHGKVPRKARYIR